MKKNVHDYERIFRLLSGAFLTSLAFWGPKNKGFLSFSILMGTGFIGTCPLYSMLGINTRNKARRSLDNEYFPKQSDSERAAGHPIVGVT